MKPYYKMHFPFKSQIYSWYNIDCILLWFDIDKRFELSEASLEYLVFLHGIQFCLKKPYMKTVNWDKNIFAMKNTLSGKWVSVISYFSKKVIAQCYP